MTGCSVQGMETAIHRGNKDDIQQVEWLVYTISKGIVCFADMDSGREVSDAVFDWLSEGDDFCDAYARKEREEKDVNVRRKLGHGLSSHHAFEVVVGRRVASRSLRTLSVLGR